MRKRFLAAAIAACTAFSSVPAWADLGNDAEIYTIQQDKLSGSFQIAGINVYYATEEAFDDNGEVVIGEETFSKNNMSSIDGSKVYYYVNEDVSGATYFGTATFSYTDYYADNTSVSEYDAITSATTRKNNIFPNEDSTAVTEQGYSILGVKNVNVSVNAKTYIEAKILSEAGNLPESGVYAKAAGITLNDDTTKEVAQTKTLNSDGNYSGLKLNVVNQITDATATLNTSSNWGDYEINITETSTNFIKSRGNTVENGAKIGNDIEGIILESTDGTKVGMRHLREIWVNPGGIAFDADSVAGKNFIGKQISKITFINQDESYEYQLNEPVYICPQVDKEKVTAAFSQDLKSVSVDLSALPSDIKNPRLSLFRREGRSSIYYVQDVELDKDAVEITSENLLESGKEYSITIKSDNYADVKLKGTVYGFDASLSATSFTYDGTEVKPQVNVTGLEDVDSELYDVKYDYKNNTNAGDAQVVVTVSDKAGYAVSKTLDFKINPADITVYKATLAKTSYTYSGKAYTPTVNIQGLTKGKDYTVSYSNNKNAGKATVKITGKGNYKGSITKTFTIAKKATKLTVKKSYTLTQNAKSFNLKAVTTGDGKVTYVSSNKKLVTVDSKGKVTLVKNAVGKTTITIKAAAGKNYGAAVAKVTIVVKPGNISKLNLKSSKNKINLSWTANKALVGYEIQYSTRADFKGAKTKKSSKASLILSNLASKRVYYVRVRAYKKVAGATLYSAFKTGKIKTK